MKGLEEYENQEENHTMKDEQIIDLYWERSEKAVSASALKYGTYCFRIAYNILSNKEDSEESVNDTWLAAWNSMPPKRPGFLAAFLGKITRYISLDRWKKYTAVKRGNGEIPLVLDELAECISSGNSVEEEYQQKEFARSLNLFIERLSETERRVFLCRYWYMDSIGQIAKRFGFTESKVASMLHRTRKKLKRMLEQEGLA